MNTATSRWNVLLTWGLPLAGLLLLQAWTRALWAGYLLVAVAAFIGVLVVRRRRVALGPPAQRAYRTGLLLLGLGLLVAGIAHWRFELIEFRWERLRPTRERQLAADISGRLEAMREAGSNAAAAAAATAADSAGHTLLFQHLADLRERTGVDALAVFSADAAPLAWAGEHRGRVPEAVHDPERRFFFAERPLFSYVYFIQPVPGRREHAVAATLVETGVQEETGAWQPEQFEQPFGPGVGFHTAHHSSPGTRIWSLLDRQDTVVQAVLKPLDQAERRAEVERVPRRLTSLLTLVAFIAFSVAFLATPAPLRGPRAAPLLALVPILALAPIGEVLGLRSVFLPTFFVLPPDLTLGRVLLLLSPIAALAASQRWRVVPANRLWLATVAGAAAAALAYPGGLKLFLDAATRPLLEEGSGLWVALQFACVLLLTVLSSLALPRTAPTDSPQEAWYTGLLAPAGAALALLLGLAAALLLSPMTPTPRYAALWALPFVLIAFGTSAGVTRRAGLRRWLYAGWLAITAVMPHMWVAQVHARLVTAEDELSTLGGQSNPYLRYALEEFGRQARARAYTGEDGVQLLYRTWVASGLASVDVPTRITQWSPDNLPVIQFGSYTEELTQSEASVLLELLDESRVEGANAVISPPDQPHISSLLTVPLPTGDVITVIVPPRRTLSRPTGAALFFGAERSTALRNLVPTAASEPPDQPEWQQARGGWRARSLVRYPDGQYWAHLLVPLPPRGVWLARAVIVLSLDLAMLLVLWAIGLLGRGVSLLPRGSLVRALGTFRARVTIALFGFFLIPTVAFGYTAYHALAKEVERATQVVAERAAKQAVREIPNFEFVLPALAQHANADVLLFQDGELVSVSSQEAFELGIYSAWMPPLQYAQLRSGEEETVIAVQEFAGQPFVTAYNALQPSGTLAIPMPLVSGDIAVRQRELAHLVIFAAIVGALLSLALSVAAGRALAGPIGLLRRAAAAVGAGRLRVQLPEAEGGEFGQLFSSFNRMVRRLRRARARERRTARVLAWGEMARQVAHEIKNPLTPIKLSVQHLRRAHQDRHPHFDAILEGSAHEILREIDRLSEIARAFSRYGAPAVAAGPLEAVDVTAVVHEALTLYRAGDEAVTYEALLEPGLPRAQSRNGELKEVLLNLLENARTALRAGGRITVRAQQREDALELEVEDDGSGIAPELLPRVFEPHFSTRSSGTGLGLAIVRRLVESWQGTVAVVSRPGQGTTVTVRLRVAAAPSAAESHRTR